MNSSSSQLLTDEEIHLLIDGQASAETLAGLQARLANNPDAQRTAAQWKLQREKLKLLHQQALGEPVPAGLLAGATRAARAQREFRQSWRWGGLAAGLMLAFGIGWTSHGQLNPRHAPAREAVAPASLAFARQASIAHAVFAPEVRHPVEVTAAEREHLVTWLSRRVGRPLKVPQLSAEGYELVGGRLLPGGHEQAAIRAQFMYQNQAGTRLTLYLGAVGEQPDDALNNRETAFSFVDDGAAPSFYWVDQGFGYALSGPLSEEALMKIGKAVYRQL